MYKNEYSDKKLFQLHNIPQNDYSTAWKHAVFKFSTVHSRQVVLKNLLLVRGDAAADYSQATYCVVCVIVAEPLCSSVNAFLKNNAMTCLIFYGKRKACVCRKTIARFWPSPLQPPSRNVQRPLSQQRYDLREPLFAQNLSSSHCLEKLVQMSPSLVSRYWERGFEFHPLVISSLRLNGTGFRYHYRQVW
jgi:hypothetical protein